MRNRYKYILLGLVLLLPKLHQAQGGGGLLLYNMEKMPQINSMNPAFFPDNSWYIALPGFNISTYIPVNPYPYVKTVGGERVLNANDFLNGLNDVNKVGLSPNISLFGFGFQKDKWFVTFSTEVHTSAYINLKKDFFELLVNGNGNYLGSDNELEIISGRFVAARAWSEISVGGGYKIDENWTVGAHLKYLTGYLDVSTGGSKLSVYTSQNIDSLVARYSINLNTAGMFTYDSLDLNTLEATSYLPNNHGFGVDIGVEYKLNDKFQFSASIVDWGFIRWKENVKEVVNEDGPGEFAFTGFNEAKDIFDGDFITVLADSLKDIIKLKSIENAPSYTSSLPFKFYLSGSYNIFPYLKASLLYRGEILDKTYFSSTNINLNYRLGNWLELSLGNSFIGQTWFNLGFGGSVALGPWQMYLIINQMSSFRVAHIKSMGFQFGSNLVFGKGVKTVKKESSETTVKL